MAATGDEPDKDDIADALSRMAEGLPDKPQRPPQPVPPPSAAQFRAPAQPGAPSGGAPSPPPAPVPTPAANPRPTRPTRPERPRPDRPADPPTASATEDLPTAAEEYDPMSSIVDDDDVIVPPPEPDVFAPHAAPNPTASPGGIRSLAFRRTVIPILLTCGVLLIGIGLLRWIGGPDSVFAGVSIPLSATLCGTGAFLLLVAALNMLQVKSELAAAGKRER